MLLEPSLLSSIFQDDLWVCSGRNNCFFVGVYPHVESTEKEGDHWKNWTCQLLWEWRISVGVHQKYRCNHRWRRPCRFCAGLQPCQGLCHLTYHLSSTWKFWNLVSSISNSVFQNVLFSILFFSFFNYRAS